MPLPFAARLGPVREGLRLAVTQGTGTMLRDLPIPAGSKTASHQSFGVRGGFFAARRLRQGFERSGAECQG